MTDVDVSAAVPWSHVTQPADSPAPLPITPARQDLLDELVRILIEGAQLVVARRRAALEDQPASDPASDCNAP